jgi:hypothetical protein
VGSRGCGVLGLGGEAVLGWHLGDTLDEDRALVPDREV